MNKLKKPDREEIKRYNEQKTRNKEKGNIWK